MARFHNGTVAEDGIDLKFEVEDENDNPPVFAPVPPAKVKESSPPGKTLFSVALLLLPQKREMSQTKLSTQVAQFI